MQEPSESDDGDPYGSLLEELLRPGGLKRPTHPPRPCTVTDEDPWEGDKPKALAIWERARDDPDPETFHAVCRKYSHGMLDMPALHELLRCSPLVDVCAGTGYWARILLDMGADVLAFDRMPPDGTKRNTWHASVPCWTHVEVGDYKRAAEFDDRTLFACWPQDGWEVDLLPHVTSSRIAVIRHHSMPIAGYPYCNEEAPPDVNPLERHWCRVLNMQQPTWRFRPNVLTIWERRR